MVHSVISTSAADTEKTLTISRGNKRRIFIRNITVTTRGADIAKDVQIIVNDNAVAIWKASLRSAKVFGGAFDLGKGIPVRDGDCTIVVDDAGASCITDTSVIYEIV